MLQNKLLFIVNPISGVKNNKAIAQLIIQHLNNYHIKYETLYTKKKGHAKSYVNSMSSELYHSILIFCQR